MGRFGREEFAVQDYLVLVKDNILPDSYSVEDCGNFFKELEGFHIYVRKADFDKIKMFLKNMPNGGFITKTFEADASNGLKLLKRFLAINSYTELFINYYGDIQTILNSFGETVISEQMTEIENDVFDYESEPQNLASYYEQHETIESIEEPGDFIDSSLFNKSSDVDEKDSLYLGDNIDMDYYSNPENTVSDSSVYEEQAIVSQQQEEQLNESLLSNYQAPAVMNEQASEVMSIIRRIADKLGVAMYEDEDLLSKEDLRNAQIAIKSLSLATVQEGILGALALADSKNDLAAVTRFLELFYKYLNENSLLR